MQVDQRPRRGIGAALIALAAVASGAHAYQPGEWIVRVGAATVDARDSSGTVAIDAVGALPGTGAGVDNATSPGLSATYMFAPAWGVELLVAAPFQHDLTGKGLGIDRVGNIRHLPPTLTLQYYFAPAGSRIQPYAGVGLNYTVFFQERESSAARTALGATSLDLDDSIGVAAQLGIDVQLGDRWLINAAVWHVDIDTTVKLETALGRAKVDVDIDPWVYMMGVGYRF